MTNRARRKSGGEEIRLTLGSRLEYLDAVHRLAEEVGRACGFSRPQSFELGLAVREAFINALTHGNHLDRSKKVRLSFLVKGDALRVCVGDEGSGFDLEATPDPRAPENLDRSAGRGVFLMRHYVDQLEVQHEAGRGTRICMVKRLPAAAGRSQRRAKPAARRTPLAGRIASRPATLRRRG